MQQALITGGVRGIGLATARLFARKGYAVALCYSADEESAARAREEGFRVVRADVSDEEQVRALFGEIGGVDVLVNNAGVTRDGLLLSMKEEDLDRVLGASLKGAFHMTQALYRHFMKKRYGRIVNISSVVGLHGNAGQASYSAAKAGIIGLTKSVAKELAGRGVTCNAVAPGFIASDMTAAMTQKAKDATLQTIPMGRVGQVTDVAHAVAFLASDAAAYITGVVLRVDGGLGM